jgi:hypothetical protein
VRVLIGEGLEQIGVRTIDSGVFSFDRAGSSSDGTSAEVARCPCAA